MQIHEIFEDDFQGTDVQDQLKQNALDLLTPLVASKVPFVTVQQVIDELRSSRPGILIDRGLIMDLLNPDTLKCISKIEGDRIYLQQPADDQRAVTDTQEEKEAEQIHNKATKKAADNVAKESRSYKMQENFGRRVPPMPEPNSREHYEITVARKCKDMDEYADIMHSMGPIRNVDPPALKMRHEKERLAHVAKWNALNKSGYISTQY